MGFRYRKSINVAPGVKINVGKKSVGLSIGGKYGGVSINSKTGTTARVSAPGTGISYTKKISNKKINNASNHTNITENNKTREINKTVSLVLCIFLGFFGAHKFYEHKILSGLLYLFTIGFFGIGWIVDIILIINKPNPYYV